MTAQILKFLFIQDHFKHGGAARAAGRSFKLLERQGWDLRQVAGDEVPTRGHRLTGKPARGWGRIGEILMGRSGRKTLVENRLGQLLNTTKPDLIWFHNIAGGGKWGWSEKMIQIARDHAPVLWTLHDMWALGSGEESYWEVEEKGAGRGKRQGASGGKRKAESGKVGRCESSKVAKVFGTKGKYPVRLTAPSKWLADLTQKITGFGCVHLPNPIDLDVFYPRDQAEARRRLGLPEKGVVVLAGADSLQDPRKGFDLLMAAWERLRPQGATLALFGRHGEARPGQVYLGNLSTDEQLVAAYRATDLYVHPARMENAPCTIQESLACGTPVVAFAVGGIPEMVVPGQTGFLVSEVASNPLREALASALANPSRLEGMRKECRRWAEEAWKPDALRQKFQRVVSSQRSEDRERRAVAGSRRSEDGDL